ncbi:tubulin domain-containing protein [Gautieria morchelliformis]|nr:tubulin domain-containing protein [Gautieria morchelliformis]
MCGAMCVCAAGSNVSFREGLAPDGSTTFCPRLLLIDYKSKFASLSHINALNVGEEDAPVDLTWTGPVSEHLQDPIPQSSYHTCLDAGEDEEDEDDLDVEMDEGEHDSVPNLTSSIRFWFDYSRVFYHPRGLHRIPDPAEWERKAGWPQGVTYDTNQAVLEDSFRLFAEECDLLQGVQLCMDAPSFGSFTVSLLSRFRDEYPKLPVLSFYSLSRHDPAEVNFSYAVIRRYDLYGITLDIDLEKGYSYSTVILDSLSLSCIS